MKKQFVFILGLLISTAAIAQQPDTLDIDTVPYHSPKKASLLSLAVPGLGQVYNKKYWKVPLVYALIGTPLYFALNEAKLYNEFKDAFIAESLNEPHKYTDVYNANQLNSILENHRKNRDLFFVLTAAAYAMNILDAAVDAHLYTFDVSDDLSGVIRPSFQFDQSINRMIPSMTLSIKFAKKTHRTAF
jgi:hypothetical protein